MNEAHIVLANDDDAILLAILRRRRVFRLALWRLDDLGAVVIVVTVMVRVGHVSVLRRSWRRALWEVAALRSAGFLPDVVPASENVERLSGR